MGNGKSDLKINEEVVAKIASMAALEIDGVASMAKRAHVDFKNILDKESATRAVKIGVADGTVNIDVHICVKQSCNVKTVSESVQLNVKEKVQNMTGNAITSVNVYVDDVCIEDSAETEQE